MIIRDAKGKQRGFVTSVKRRVADRLIDSEVSSSGRSDSLLVCIEVADIGAGVEDPGRIGTGPGWSGTQRLRHREIFCRSFLRVILLQHLQSMRMSCIDDQSTDLQRDVDVGLIAKSNRSLLTAEDSNPGRCDHSLVYDTIPNIKSRVYILYTRKTHCIALDP